MMLTRRDLEMIHSLINKAVGDVPSLDFMMKELYPEPLTFEESEIVQIV